MTSGAVRVLHVEDDPAFAELTAEYLEQANLSVETEHDPERALSRLDADRVDCVVSDYRMPGLTGLELLAEVRERHPTLPFVLFTGEGNERIASDAIAAGVDEYVQKGGGASQFDLLVNRVESAVGQRRTEARLARTEERYQRLLETAPTPIVIFDRERIKFVNDAAISFIDGDSAADLVGEPPQSFFAECDVERATQRIDAVLDGDDSLEAEEYRIHTVDGNLRHAVLRPAPVTFEGAPAGQVVVTDVTEYLETQADLRHEKRTLEAAIDAVDDFFFILDETGTVVRWNDRVTEVTGYDDETLSSMSMAEFFVDDQADAVRDRIDRMLETGSAVVEAAVETADGEEIPFEFRGVRMTDEAGEVVGGCAIGRDVRDQRAYERELERYHALIETMDDPMYVVDELGQFVDVNQAMVERSGFSRSEMLGEFVGRFMDGEDVQAVTELVSDILTDPDRSSGTYEFETQDAHGQTRVVQDRVSVLTDEQGDYVATAGVLRDVTRERAQDRQLRRQNERLDRFAGLVSHDLRNPINVVQGFVDLAEETGDPDAFDRIRAAAGRMESLVADMLMLARHGAVVNDRAAIDLVSAAEEAWLSVDTGDATLVTGESRTLQADPERFAALLENLFRNAIEHGVESVRPAATGRGVDAVDRTGGDDEDGMHPTGLTIQVDATDTGFCVVDDGCGLPDNRSGLFDYGVSYEDGTGLGLAIVHEICEAHGWSVDAHDAETGGARFDVSL